MSSEHEEVERMITAALKVLHRSPRGIAVKKDVRKLLHGMICSLDGDGWDAVEALLKLYRAGWKGSVLEALETRRRV